MRPRVPPVTGLALGIGGTAFAAIFFRLADEAPTLAVAGYRMLFAAIIVAGFSAVVLSMRREAMPGRRTMALLATSGVFLAAHFWSWFASLEHTSVGSSVIIVCMQPLLAALLGYVFLREQPVRAEWIGIALAAIGLVVIGGRDFLSDPGELGGDALALAGGVFAAVYRTIGRAARGEVSTHLYSGTVYGVAAAVLWLSILVLRPQVSGYEADTWTFIVLLALIPQVVGHTAFNWALAHYRVVTVGIATLGEPILATLLAIPILGESPTLGVIVGGPFIIAGVYVGLRGATVEPSGGRRSALLSPADAPLASPPAPRG